MKKILTMVCAAALGLVLSAAETKPNKLTIGGTPLRVELTRRGYINHYLNGNRMFDLLLQVHWSRFAHQSKDLRIVMQGKDVFRAVGSFANIQFSSRTRFQSNRAETEYQLHLTEDNPFSSSSQWEVAPFFGMKRLKEMENCTYSGICVDGGKFSGNIRDFVNFPGRVRSFTVHNIEGYDLTLEFPDGALGKERRKEAKPAGLWFFVPAVMRNGSCPQKAGDTAVLRVNVEVKKNMK